MPRDNIFLSHATQDTDLARRYADELRRLGYDVWVDVDHVEPGMHLSAEITTQLRARSALVVLWSPHSINRHNVIAECAYFLGRLPDWPTKRFIPVHAVECGVAANLQLGVTPEQVLRHWQPGQYLYIDGRSHEIRDVAQQLNDTLEAPPRVLPPFRLDALDERGLTAKLAELFEACYSYGRPRLEPVLRESETGRVFQPDCLVIRADELLGKQLIVVEVKRVVGRWPVDVTPLYRLEHLLHLAGADEGWLVTTGTFAGEAADYAGWHRAIRLIDRDALVEMFRNRGTRVTTGPPPDM